MNKVILCENPVDYESWQTFEVDDVCAFLKEHFKSWPATARIYLEQVAIANDITPYDESSVERLQELKGTFYIVIYPEGIETIFIVIAIAVAAVSIGLSFLLRPSASPNVKSQNQSSPNNELAKRDNRERPGERIPDIYGKLYATPDLVQVPYRIFNGSGVEIEYCYMCVGRGSFTVAQVRDDLTPIAEVTGSSVEIYAPFTSPNSGDAPQLRIGAVIGEPLRIVKQLSSINGQTLIAPNLAGGGNWSGPFLMGDRSTTEMWFNFVAQGGMYKIDGTGAQSALSVTARVGLTPCDGAGNPLGLEVTHDITFSGSASTKERVGTTLKVVLPAAGTYLVRATRTSNTTIAANTTAVDEIQWRDAMSIAPVTNLHFGDVTTVQTLTLPTPNALALKQRKLNMLVTRNVLKGMLAGGVVTFSGGKQPSTLAADAIYDIALDSKLGNRQVSELDLPGIYQAMTDIQALFGTSLVTDFCYTFDDSKVSFEEMIQDIASSVFCNAYRRGSRISLFFEKQTNQSKMLFNHRNKLPRSEVRTVTFGRFQDNDGINLEYIEPFAPNFTNQDTLTTLYFPEDQSAINPKKITAVGVRNNVQAKLLGWRYYQKLRYQNTAVEFEATHEAALRILQERILVADNTRPDVQDGEIIGQNGLILNTSQPVNMPATYGAGIPIHYTIFIQHYDDTVESIACIAGADNRHLILSVAPSIPLVTGADTYARTTYLIVDDRADTLKRSAAFLLAEKTPKQKNTYTVKAANYDDRYYSHDGDYIGGLISYTGDDSVLTPGITPGSIYRPTNYNDIGDSPTFQPSSAFDTNPASFASISAHYTEIVGPPVISTIVNGDCRFAWFPSIAFSADTTLAIKVDTLPDNMHTFLNVNGITGLVYLGFAAGVMSWKIPSGQNIGLLEVEVLAYADVSEQDTFMNIYDIKVS